MPLRDTMPSGYTLPAAGCGSMLRNKDRMFPPGSLFTIVLWLSGRQASLDEAPGVVHHGVNSLGLELLELPSLQSEPAPE